jgi:hypothetical protein
MSLWEEFDQTFHFNKDFAYDAKIADQIVANRRALDNQLFVDRLLSLLGVNAGSYFSAPKWIEAQSTHNNPVQRLYPSRSNSDLRNLYKQIVSSHAPSHHKQAIVYYILKDCRVGSDASMLFARKCHLPEKYKLFIDGLWQLDRLELRVNFFSCLYTLRIWLT